MQKRLTPSSRSSRQDLQLAARLAVDLPTVQVNTVLKVNLDGSPRASG